MELAEIVAAVDGRFSDEMVLRAARRLFEVVGYRWQYDERQIEIPRDVKLHIDYKSLVISKEHRDGAYLVARLVLDPIFNEIGVYSGVSRGGTLKIHFALDGTHVDDFYSRENVIE